MTRKKVLLSLSGRAQDIIAANATPRKKGDFVSRVVEEWDDAQALKVNAPGVLEEIQERLLRIEAAVLRIEAK